uniref:Uncharacterized protein n=1 Tax=Arundo donax TaxID=35708 RepID=A0A0A9CLY5_ARUDO
MAPGAAAALAHRTRRRRQAREAPPPRGWRCSRSLWQPSLLNVRSLIASIFCV